MRLQFSTRLNLHEPAYSDRLAKISLGCHPFYLASLHRSPGRILRLKVGVLMRIPKTTLTFFTFALLLAGVQGGCRGSRGGETGPLPSPPPPDQMKLSNYEPQKGYTQVSPGLATRTVYTVEPTAKDPYHVDIQDILVAPGREAVSVPLQGAATFEVRGGNGTVTIGDRGQEVGNGSTFSVSEGEQLKIAAKDAPLTLRAYVVRVP